jgi:hypothetical protein
MLRFELALGGPRVRVAGIDPYLCLGLCLLTGLPDGHGLALSNIRTAPVEVPAPPQARRRRPGRAATKKEAVNTDSNARFGWKVEWNVNGTMTLFRGSWFEVGTPQKKGAYRADQGSGKSMVIAAKPRAI